MANKKPTPVAPSVLATVYFTLPGAELGFGQGHVVRFAVPPRIGDTLRVDQYSIRSLPHEELHHCEWKVVAIEHDLNLDQDLAEANDEDMPLATLRVVVHPIIRKAPRQQRRARSRAKYI